jgi:hypothetical protein
VLVFTHSFTRRLIWPSSKPGTVSFVERIVVDASNKLDTRGASGTNGTVGREVILAAAFLDTSIDLD